MRPYTGSAWEAPIVVENKNKRPTALKGRYRYLVAVVCGVLMITSSFTTVKEYLWATSQGSLCQCKCRTQGNQSSASLLSYISSKEPSLSVTLDSEEYFFRNRLNLTFETHVKIWKDEARICLNITLPDPEGQCPFPSFRARVSGVALVDIPLGNRTLQSDDHFNPHGCALFPVPGTYHLDVSLIHCTMDAWSKEVSSGVLKRKCPVVSDPRDALAVYNITVDPFERDDRSVSLFWPQRNPFPRRAFVFSPPCPGDEYKIGHDCSKANSNNNPPIVRVSYQREGDSWKNGNIKHSMSLRDYVYLVVDPNNGAMNYDATYSILNRATPPKNFESNDTVCFIGDSHARFVAFASSMIYRNESLNTTGCSGWQEHRGSPSFILGQFRYNEHALALRVPNFPTTHNNVTIYGDCDMVFILYGHHDASHTSGNRPTTPSTFVSLTKLLMEKLQAATKNDTRIFVASPDHFPMSARMQSCVDWGLPTLMDVYSASFRNMTVEGDRPGERKFKGLNNAYYMDNTDIMDHIWDSASDYNHPCLHGFRPMVYRVFAMMRGKSTGRPSYIP